MNGLACGARGDGDRQEDLPSPNVLSWLSCAYVKLVGSG